MKTTLLLIKRNTKLFFKDKGMFFTALITPGILLVLYATFLSSIYRDSFTSGLPQGFSVSEGLIDSLVASQLTSSLLAVSCVTIAFTANFLMVRDKVSGAAKDFKISAVSSSSLSLGYYISAFLSTLSICAIGMTACLIYTVTKGFYMSVLDVLLLFCDVVLLTFFGTALSSVVNFFLTSEGHISAVGTIVSASYGFICGAYMPISSFSDWLGDAVAFLPGTHATSLMRCHTMRGVLAEMNRSGVPSEVTKGLRDLLDCNLYFLDNQVSIPTMYAVLVGSSLLLVGVYILMNRLRKKK